MSFAGDQQREASTSAPQGVVDLAGSEPAPRRVGLFDRDWQKALWILLTILAACAVAWVVWQLISPILRTVMLFVLSAVLAFILSAPVGALAARNGNRLASIIVVYVAAGLIIFGGLTLMAGPFVGQATALVMALPEYASEIEARTPDVEGMLGQYGIRTSADDLRARAAAAVEQGAVDLLGHLVGTLAEVGGVLADVFLALVISFYLLQDGPAIRRRVLALVPEEHKGKAQFLEENMTRVLGGYLRGQLVMAATIGVLAGLGCSLLGLPYAVVLGVLAGLFELVPMFGPILSAIPAVLVALFMPFPTVLWVIVFFVIVQQVESNILGPRITGHAVGLHPLGALFALLAGFQLAGVLGALFAVPVAGMLWVLMGAGYRNVVAPPPPRPSWWPRRWRRSAGPDDVVAGKTG